MVCYFPFRFLINRRPVNGFSRLRFRPNSTIINLFCFAIRRINNGLLRVINNTYNNERCRGLKYYVFGRYYCVFRSLCNTSKDSTRFAGFRFLFLFWRFRGYVRPSILPSNFSFRITSFRGKEKERRKLSLKLNLRGTTITLL